MESCPRCRSKRRLRSRLDGGRVCRRCGQRITREGELVPSFDRRSWGLEDLNGNERSGKSSEGAG